jgi:transposase
MTWVAHDDVDRATLRKEPTVSKHNSASPNTTWVGLDVHRDSITSAVLAPDVATPVLDRWFHDEPSVRRFVKSFSNPKTVRLCYEAGPTGYGLARLLERLGVSTEVIAPSFILKGPNTHAKDRHGLSSTFLDQRGGDHVPLREARRRAVHAGA